MAGVSKNQRVHPKQKPRIFRCAQGHERVNVDFVGQGFRLVCECDGYKTIDTTQPYNPRKGKIMQGKARIMFEQPSGT